MPQDEDVRPLEPIEDEIEVEEPDPIDDPQSYAEERERARILVPNKLVMAVMLLLLILLLASALGLNIGILAGGKSVGPKQNNAPAATKVFSGSVQGLPGDPSGGSTGEGSENPIATIGLSGDEIYIVDPLFRAYYDSHGGERIFGKPISHAQDKDVPGKRAYQWFERARLEYWRENLEDDPEHVVQPGLVGREFTDNRDFPRQTHFVNRTDLWYFAETQHAVGGRFLQFWLANGGLDVFGYPISEEVVEVLPSDGLQHVVQYFERARFEYHPGAEQEVMLGLLGRALYPANSKPAIVEDYVIAPTAVPDSPE